MNSYIVADPWKVIEDRFDPGVHQNTESLMSLGNGRMGQRANFEETYSGKSLQGSYIAGVYYPDKTRVGWWKNGYPEYFAKVLNSVNWIKLIVLIDGEEIDLAKSEITEYHRELDMQHGILARKVVIRTAKGKNIAIHSERFYSIVDLDTCYLKYSITSLTDDIEVCIKSVLDFNVRNADANYDNDFWKDRNQGISGNFPWVSATTKKTDFHVVSMAATTINDRQKKEWSQQNEVNKGIVTEIYSGRIKARQETTLTKCVVITSSFYYEKDDVFAVAREKANSNDFKDYVKAVQLHREAWIQRWQQSDIRIEGDISAQQGIRFNIYQLYQTYSGEDARLNIGPKGFSGEKYGGSTYWDTEAYCLPFYMCTTDISVARNLLLYRHNHLKKAIENAQKLGFKNGAALYPMVTINGEECHNEWEITFEEIHRNGAIGFAIFDYIRYSGDQAYMISHGLEVLIAISRFWSQRMHVSPVLDQYVMLGVTGPNEYENNVDNNWYTNYIAQWCLKYTCQNIDWMKSSFPFEWSALSDKVTFQDSERTRWDDIIHRIYFPFDPVKNIFIQHDGYLNKENITVEDLHASDRPINQKWSWDRILRSPFIKQADVLQGLYFFEDQFTKDEIERNFRYYEPRTVHESSLSPCVHAILAASLGMKDKAYEMYLRTARLDLDDYNNDTEDGCHITSMAGTWMSIVKGFAGMRVGKDGLSFNPFLPENWKAYSFNIIFRESLLLVTIDKEAISIHNNSDKVVHLNLCDKHFIIHPGSNAKHQITGTGHPQ